MMDESARLRTLRSLGVLDTPAEPVFDRIARLASSLCGTPIALVSLIDDDRQWFKANLGLDGVSETPRAIAFCSKAIQGDSVFVVEDAQADPRFAANPLVLGDPHVRFYAGAPIVMPDGGAIGTVCVIDRDARQLTEQQRMLLSELSALARDALINRSAVNATLASSHAALRRAEEMARVGGWTADLANRTATWTPGMTTLCGVPADQTPEFDGQRRLFDDAANAEIDRAAAAAVLEGKSWDLQLPMRRPDGSRIWVRTVGHPEYEDGRVRRLVGTLQDISDLHERELRISATSELLRTVVDNLPCGVSAFDGSLRLLLDNAEFRRLLDLPQSLFADGLTDFSRIIRYNADRGEYGPDADAAYEAIVARARDPVTHAIHRTRPDGTVLDIRGAPLPRGGFVTTYMDVTSERRMAEALRRSEERQQRALAASRAVLWDYDVPADVLYLSQRWAELMGLPPGPTETSMAALVKHIPPQERQAVTDAWLAALKGDADQFVSEHRIITPSGGEIWFMVQGEVVERNAAGRAIRVTGTNTDITLRKSMESELQQAKALAERSNRAKGDFIATVSHEMRTPLHGVLTLLRLIASTEDLASSTRYAQLAQASAESLLQLINELLDDSKIEAGKLEVVAAEFDHAAMLDELDAVYRVRCAEKNLRFSLVRDAAVPPRVKLDGFRLRQILQNLLTNALKFTQQGSVTLAVSGDKGDFLVFEVSDTGIGMSADERGALFERFHQAESTTASKFGGTGLGLAISRQLARLMGGEITVDSEQGVGSRFILRVPFQRCGQTGDESAKAAPVNLKKVADRQGSVLVVDDNEVNRFVASEVLKRLGVREVATAVDGASAVEVAMSMRPELILMDCQMPGMDGYEATARLRQLAFKGPIVAFTAAESESEATRCLEAGMDATLSKPVDVRKLKAVLDRWLVPEGAASVDDFNSTVFEARFAFNPELGQKVLQTFVQISQTEVDLLVEHARAEDREAASRLAHKIVGSASTVAADRVWKLAAQIESTAAGLTGQQLRDAADALAHAFARFRAAVSHKLPH